MMMMMAMMVVEVVNGEHDADDVGYSEGDDNVDSDKDSGDDLFCIPYCDEVFLEAMTTIQEVASQTRIPYSCRCSFAQGLTS